MSKYNRIVSIPIESIPEKDIKKAIHQWAEGDDSMEKLLLACYEKGIDTSGCHAGARPWIDFKYQDNMNRLIPLLEVTQKVEESQIVIMVDGGNPFSGPEWYLSSIGMGIDTMYKDEADVYFDSLTNALEDDSNKTHPVLELLEFFLNKESGIVLRFRHNKNNKFVFYIEARISDERCKYYDNLFKKAGMEETINNTGDDKRHAWKIEDDRLENILKRIENAKDIITKEYDLKPEEDEEKIFAYTLKARYKMKTLTEKEFEEWLKQEKKRLF